MGDYRNIPLWHDVTETVLVHRRRPVRRGKLPAGPNEVASPSDRKVIFRNYEGDPISLDPGDPDRRKGGKAR